MTTLTLCPCLLCRLCRQGRPCLPRCWGRGSHRCRLADRSRRFLWLDLAQSAGRARSGPGADEAETGEKQSSSREVEFGNPVADSEDEDEDESGDDKKGGKKGKGK